MVEYTSHQVHPSFRPSKQLLRWSLIFEHARIGSISMHIPLLSLFLVTFMWGQVTAKEKIAKFDPIYRNQWVNIIMKHERKILLANQIIYRIMKNIQQINGSSKQRSKASAPYLETKTRLLSKISSPFPWLPTSPHHPLRRWKKLNLHKSMNWAIMIKEKT